MKHAIDHILWLGGSPCSGKTSISEILAVRSGLRIYHVDQAFDTHIHRLEPARHPALTRWLDASWDERWMQPVKQLTREAIACYTEHFSIMLDDVLALPIDGRLLVEGTAVLPVLAAQLGAERKNALWVVPEADFQRSHYARRDWVRGILAECADPRAAFDNWMERDTRFAAWVVDEAARLGFAAYSVDGSQTVEEMAGRAMDHFGL